MNIPTPEIPNTIGVEMTYILPINTTELPHPALMKQYRKWTCDDYRTEGSHESLSAFIRYKLNKLKMLEKANVSADCEAIEISSPIFRSWERFKDYYIKLDQICKAYGLVPRSETEWGGMGHINLGLDITSELKYQRFIKYIHRDLVNRPYLNWIFNAAGEDWNANSYLYNYSTYRTKECHDSWIEGEEEVDILRLLSGNKQASHNFNDTHEKDRTKVYIEFRFFEMYENIDEFQKCVNFITRYYNYIKKSSETESFPKYKFESVRDFQKAFPSAKKCISHFRELLHHLDLKYSDYRYLVERNLKVRYEVYPDTLV